MSHATRRTSVLGSHLLKLATHILTPAILDRLDRVIYNYTINPFGPHVRRSGPLLEDVFSPSLKLPLLPNERSIIYILFNTEIDFFLVVYNCTCPINECMMRV